MSFNDSKLKNLREKSYILRRKQRRRLLRRRRPETQHTMRNGKNYGKIQLTCHSKRFSSFTFTRKPSTGSSWRLLYSKLRALTAELTDGFIDSLDFDFLFSIYFFLFLHSVRYSYQIFTRFFAIAKQFSTFC